MSRSSALAKAADAARALAEALAELATEPPAETSPEHYDSRNLPPRTSKRRFAEVCRSGRVPGAHREGRHWVCSRTAWHGARINAPKRPEKLPETPPPEPALGLADRAEALLRRQGLRFLSPGRRAPDGRNAT